MAYVMSDKEREEQYEIEAAMEESIYNKYVRINIFSENDKKFRVEHIDDPIVRFVLKNKSKFDLMVDLLSAILALIVMYIFAYYLFPSFANVTDQIISANRNLCFWIPLDVAYLISIVYLYNRSKNEEPWAYATGYFCVNKGWLRHRSDWENRQDELTEIRLETTVPEIGKKLLGTDNSFGYKLEYFGEKNIENTTTFIRFTSYIGGRPRIWMYFKTRDY